MTLVEIMVVLVILGLIAGAVVINLVSNLDTARTDRVRMDLGAIENALKIYYAKHGRYPDTAAGLSALEVSPFQDPWGNDYLYVNEAPTPLLRSLGRDGLPGGEGADADLDNRQLAR